MCRSLGVDLIAHGRITPAPPDRWKRRVTLSNASWAGSKFRPVHSLEELNADLKWRNHFNTTADHGSATVKPARISG